jgi:hypothetical protein
VIVNVCPAIVNVPALDDDAPLAEPVKATVPLPVTDDPPVTESQEALLEAVQEQSVGVAVTVTEPVLAAPLIRTALVLNE